jgi:hypothetical protein
MIITFDQLFKLLLLPVTLLAACLDKIGDGYSIGPPCIFKTFFDTECIGCGITHAIIDIWHGDIISSYHHNKMGLVVFVVIIFISINEFLSVKLNLIKGRK